MAWSASIQSASSRTSFDTRPIGRRADRFKLRAFQRDFLTKLFREVRGHRVYTRALWGLPRKNGKSEIAAAVGTKMLVADGTYGAEVISVAGDRAQAGIVFDSATGQPGLSCANPFLVQDRLVDLAEHPDEHRP